MAISPKSTLLTHLRRDILFTGDITRDAPNDSALRAALEQLLDHATHFFVYYLWEHRQSLQVLHPWLCKAYQDFSCQ